MLDTLFKIGDWQSQGIGLWDRFLDKPKINDTDKNGNKINNYIMPVVFDLDKGELVQGGPDLLREYDDTYLDSLKVLKPLGRRFKPFFVSSLSGKFDQIFKSLFGKPFSHAEKGEVRAIIDDECPSLKDSRLVKILDEIFKLKETCETNFIDDRGKASPSKIKEFYKLDPKIKIVLFYVTVKYSSLGIDDYLPLAQLEEYEEFLKLKLVGNELADATEKRDEKLCYVTNTYLEDVDELSLTSSYSLNKMFVTTTQNYLSDFQKNKASHNYQVSKKVQEKLDIASKYLLQNLLVQIAGVNHVIIPQFLSKDDVDLELAIERIQKKKELLFGFKMLDNWVKNITGETENIFWLNFLAYDSDGNFFKTTENIKDVSSFHFQKVLETFGDVHWDFKELPYMKWNQIMRNEDQVSFFNFGYVYPLVPVRKDEKKNRALLLFKTILENRKIEISSLYGYFCELILCHYFERYNSYSNIFPSSRDYFYFSVRNSVVKYFAFIEVLKRLNLIDMTEETKQARIEKAKKYDKAIFDFFDRMQLNSPQQAMFYLGRMLNTVEYIQEGKKKTVIEKVNFNGMDRDDIQRLRISLIEKAKQYGQIGKVKFTDDHFGDLFDYNNWSLDPQEAVFFLLTGYSFGSSSKEPTSADKSEVETD